MRDALVPSFCTNWIPISRRLSRQEPKELILKDFSFAKNPKGTLASLSELAEACAKYPDLRLNFLDTDCDDVTPYIVLAHLGRALPPIISGGRITHEVGEVVDAVGMRSDLRIGTIKKTRTDSYSVSAFRLVKRAPPGTFGDKDHLLRPQLKEYVADRLCDTLNDWLREHQLELRQEAEASLVSGIGEALDNAERHGDMLNTQSEGDWSIAAFSRLEHSGTTPMLRCSVGIVSIGSTIAGSLNSAASSVQDRIIRYVTQHQGMISSKAKAESLRTVMALQDGITRVEKATAGRRGGVGFMELIDAFAELGDNDLPDLESVFTIISGRTCLRITGKYRQGVRNSSGLRELWFNAGNEMAQPPSTEHVFSLDRQFPGVVLSACFTIDPEHLRKKYEP